MASTTSKTTGPDEQSSRHGKGYTPPKGRATASNVRAAGSRRMSPNLEWVIAAIVFVAVLAAVFYFGSDFNTPGGGGGGGDSGAPALITESFDATG